MLEIPYNKDLELPQKPLGTMHHYPWDETGYTPEGTITMVHNDEALRVRLTSPVGDPTILTTTDGGPVWEDNCPELFLMPYPATNKEYINFECNAFGAMVIGKGEDRHDREDLVKEFKPKLNVQAVITPGEGFEITYTIPFMELNRFYHTAPLSGGSVIRFNAFICGEATPIAHFGSFFPIKSPEPDFHRPEYFGEARLMYSWEMEVRSDASF